jgi:hypothetical protein
MSPETDAAVEKLTAELNEFTAICGRIRADMDELYFLSLVSALAEAINAKKCNKIK